MFFIDFQSRTPVFEQIINQVENFVLAGVLHPDDKLPSIRELTAQIGVNPNTIQKAYNELDSRGIIISVNGRGCFISKNVYEVLKKRAEARLPDFESSALALFRAGIDRETLINVISKATQASENK
ncbi:MAG: GntR family transcriptional regulator [Eubacteriales bacterium]